MSNVALPRAQINPRDNGCSWSPLTSSILPSRNVTLSPHAGSHTRQYVYLISSIIPPPSSSFPLGTSILARPASGAPETDPAFGEVMEDSQARLRDGTAKRRSCDEVLGE